MEQILQYINSNSNWLFPIGLCGFGFAQGVWTWHWTHNKRIAIFLGIAVPVAFAITWYFVKPALGL